MTSFFFDRNKAELQLVRRIVTEVSRDCHPLLERLRFLALAAAGLDSFAMVRLPRVRSAAAPPATLSEQDEIVREIDELHRLKHESWSVLRRELTAAGIGVLDRCELTRKEREWLAQHAATELLPQLTPVAVDAAHPLPRLGTLDKAIALDLRCRASHLSRLVVIRMPDTLPRFVELPDFYGRDVRHFVPVETCVIAAAPALFRDHELRSAGLFRILRDGELDWSADEEVATRKVARGVRRRATNRPVRLEVQEDLASGPMQVLRRSLGVPSRSVARLAGLIGLRDLSFIADLNEPALRFPPHQPRRPAVVSSQRSDIFRALGDADILLHHPYDSFDVVIDFLRQAARDPDVVALRQTLYRTSADSPVVQALCEAAEAGKSVTALVELRARFDEEANLRWSREMARSGVQVVHGVADLKMHAKLALVVRREDKGLATYCHFGTGNYNPVTAASYSDLSLLTADTALGRDATQLFHFATGFADPSMMTDIAIAPHGIREVLMARIEDEIRHANAGRPARIWLKCNALTDRALIEALYRASGEGVEIDLMIRGACCLRPGVPGLSDRIRVRSLIGRFLEHARVYAFGSGWGLPHPRAAVFVSSADLMTRNLDRRLETLVPVRDPGAHERILSVILAAHLADTSQTWLLQPDGTSVRAEPAAGQSALSAQDFFLQGGGMPQRQARTQGTLPGHWLGPRRVA